MSQNRYFLLVLIGILLAVFFGVALYLRVGFVYDQVFVGDQVRFTETDAYYHMRLVDNLLHHFPARITFDPYTYYPHGAPVPWPPFFDWLVAGIAWIFGMGSPTQHTAEMVGTWLPAILGALAVIPVYFVGKVLFNRWVGVIAAGLIAVHPGGFLTYSTLGFCDHHVAEALFSTLTMLFLILSLKHARQRQLTFTHVRQPKLAVLSKPLLYSLLAGLFFGIYLLTWVGGLLLLFILFIYFVVQSIIDHLQGESTDYLLIVMFPLLLVGGAISFPALMQIWTAPIYLFSLPVALLVPIVLVTISNLFKQRLNRIYYPAAVVGLGLVGLAVLWVVNPTLLKSALWSFRYVLPSGDTAITIWEAQPILFPLGKFSLSVVWNEFTIGFFLSLISLGVITYSFIKRGRTEETLLLVWSLIMLCAVLGQRRYTYYFAVNVSLLTGYLSWCILHLFGCREEGTVHVDIPKAMERKGTKAERSGKFNAGSGAWAKTALGLVIVSLVFIPTTVQAINNAQLPRFTPDEAWSESLSWLRDKTPDPFGNTGAYYQIYEPPPWRQNYAYPESAYGVMAWWDYGHWITRTAHRIPVANPFQQGAREAAQFFLATDETSANDIVNRLGAKYVMVDQRTAMGFSSTATWAGLNEADFYETYYQRQNSMLVSTTLFYPRYYRSLCVRLYVFDGRAVVPDVSTVISYEVKTDLSGGRYREIISSENFSTYKAAEDYLSKQTTGNYKIVGLSSIVSPVPLERLKNYKLVHESRAANKYSLVGVAQKVQIFEYVK